MSLLPEGALHKDKHHIEVEKLRDKYNESDDAQEKQEFAIEAGKLIAEEMMENTDDRVGLIKQIKV